ncbi:MAG: hypothetical protein Q9174_005294 [Haloplaca sp. 1 TL-2023]
MPKNHRDNLKDLFRQIFDHPDGIYERPYPLLDFSEVDCIPDLVEEGHTFPYIAKGIFKVQAISALGDIDNGFKPDKLTRIVTSDIELCYERRHTWKDEKKRMNINYTKGKAREQWDWIDDKTREGTIDNAMRRLFVDAEKKHRGDNVKTVYVRDLRAQYYQVVDHPLKYE